MRSKKEIQQYHTQFCQRAYDNISIRVKRGRRSKYDRAAKKAGMSLRAYIEAALQFAAESHDFLSSIKAEETEEESMEETEQ